MAWYSVTRYRKWPPLIIRSYGDLVLMEQAVAQRAWVWGKRRAFQLMRRWAADGSWVKVVLAIRVGTFPHALLHSFGVLPRDVPHRRVSIQPPEEGLWMNYL